MAFKLTMTSFVFFMLMILEFSLPVTLSAPLHIELLVGNGIHGELSSLNQHRNGAHYTTTATKYSGTKNIINTILERSRQQKGKNASIFSRKLQNDAGNKFIPIEIVVDGLDWKQLASERGNNFKTVAPAENRPTYPIWRVKSVDHSGKNDRRPVDRVSGTNVVVVDERKPEVEYGLDILNKQLPSELTDCYTNMTNDALEWKVYSPAAYGERLCGNMETAEICAKSQSGAAALSFISDIRRVRMTLCDPDCPFAQVESCKTKIVASAADESCRVASVLSCIDSMLAQLRCKTDSAALIYWLRSKALTTLKYCDSQSEVCIDSVTSCLHPLLDYASHRSLSKLCRDQEKITQCLTGVTKDDCIRSEVIVAVTNTTLNELNNQICT